MLSPSLILDFTTEAGRRAARRHLTCTRAGPGAEWTPGGILRPDVPDNWMRFGRNGLLVERSRENLITDPDARNASNIANGTVTQVSDPRFGDVYKFTDSVDGSNKWHFVYLDQPHTLNGANANGAFIKPLLSDNIYLSFRGNLYDGVNFNLATNAIEFDAGEIDGAFAVPVVDGWYWVEWVSSTQTAFTVAACNAAGEYNYMGTGQDAFLIAKPHAQPGRAWVGSYVEALGAATTHQDDDITLPVGDWFNPRQHTWFMEYEATPEPSTRFMLNENATGWRYRSDIADLGSPEGSTSVNYTSHPNPVRGDIVRSVVTVDWGDNPTGASAFDVGRKGTAFHHDGAISRLIHYPGLLTQSEAEALIA